MALELRVDMTLSKHLDEAAERLERSAYRMAAVRSEPPTLAALHEWLSALTDYAEALSDIQRLGNESIHEKLHAIAGRAGVRDVL